MVGVPISPRSRRDLGSRVVAAKPGIGEVGVCLIVLLGELVRPRLALQPALGHADRTAVVRAVLLSIALTCISTPALS